MIRKEGRKKSEGREEGTKHAVHTSIKYSQVFRPLFSFYSVSPPLLSLFISSPVWPDGLALCPEVDLLISGSASVGNRGRARGTRTRLQQNAGCSYTSYPSKCLSQKQNNTEPAERHKFSTLSPLSCRFTLTEISKPFIYNLTQFFFFIAQVTPIHSFIQSLLVDIWWFHLV